MLTALSPLDGRYEKTLEPLRHFFSEQALIRARVFVEITYFLALSRERKIREFPRMNEKQRAKVWNIVEKFDAREAAKVKAIEEVTRHDVKAVEYYVKKKLQSIPGLQDAREFVHFALTSDDINNLAYGMLIHRSLQQVILPGLTGLLRTLTRMSTAAKTVKLLSLTHGQPATPTTMGKELLVFVARLERQLSALKRFRMQGKFSGAVGTHAAHKVAYPEVRWESFSHRFVAALGLEPLRYTTQINPHDDLAELSHLVLRINAILLDFCRDMWLYISRGIWEQTIIAGEVGSSTMPHKVNPIDFENAEGNLGLSSALFGHFAEKLPLSRLQRDLSDSTVQRNIGSAFGYHLLAVQGIARGLGRLSLDRAVIQSELRAHPEVIAEAIQTLLRKHHVSGAYEKLKQLTRGKRVSREDLLVFIAQLVIPEEEKERLQDMLE